ncbi:MAG: uL15 family ribosomal protein, partial [Clostridia bacterium]|nr:uL15 family ribosomal protein [Clostridia bacterium]
NIDTLSMHFDTGDTVTLEALKEKGLLPAKTDYIKVLAHGSLNKHLTVEAQDYSADAIKMIILTGGKVIKKI